MTALRFTACVANFLKTLIYTKYKWKRHNVTIDTSSGDIYINISMVTIEKAVVKNIINSWVYVL